MIIDNINDTICAISTPPGIGGIAVIRISGPEAIEITKRVWKGRDLSTVETHSAHLGELIDRSCGDVIDQCVATIFKAPDLIPERKQSNSPFTDRNGYNAKLWLCCNAMVAAWLKPVNTPEEP